MLIFYFCFQLLNAVFLKDSSSGHDFPDMFSLARTVASLYIHMEKS